MQNFRNYPWPGNVRELENTLERSLLFTKDNEITHMDFNLQDDKKNGASWAEIKENTLRDAEQTFLKNALSQFQGDVKKVAENMEISTRAVYSKLKKHQINVSSYR